MFSEMGIEMICGSINNSPVGINDKFVTFEHEIYEIYNLYSCKPKKIFSTTEKIIKIIDDRFLTSIGNVYEITHKRQVILKEKYITDIGDGIFLGFNGKFWLSCGLVLNGFREIACDGFWINYVIDIHGNIYKKNNLAIIKTNIISVKYCFPGIIDMKKLSDVKFQYF